MLNISTCNFVSFPTTGFPKSKKLKFLQIRQMNLFHLNSGIFPIISNLAIEDVSELIIDGFQGQNNLVNIEIKNVVLSELNEDSFKDIKSLEKLTFQNVSIYTLHTGSLHILSNMSKLVVKFLNCKVSLNRIFEKSHEVIKYFYIKSKIKKKKILSKLINVNHLRKLCSFTDQIF